MSLGFFDSGPVQTHLPHLRHTLLKSTSTPVVVDFVGGRDRVFGETVLDSDAGSFRTASTVAGLLMGCVTDCETGLLIDLLIAVVRDNLSNSPCQSKASGAPNKTLRLGCFHFQFPRSLATCHLTTLSIWVLVTLRVSPGCWEYTKFIGSCAALVNNGL